VRRSLFETNIQYGLHERRPDIDSMPLLSLYGPFPLDTLRAVQRSSGRGAACGRCALSHHI